MTRDLLTDQPNAEEKITEDELSQSDREKAGEARSALAWFTEQSPPEQPVVDRPHVDATQSGRRDKAPQFRPGRMECGFSLSAAKLVSAIVAVDLPPSDLPKLLNRHEKPLTKPLHQICFTVDATGLRITNRKEGVTCELNLPIANFSTSGAASHSFLVPLAHLEGLFPDRPYRSGRQRLRKVTWAAEPDVTFEYCRPDRRLTVQFGGSAWDLSAEPCDPPEPLPQIADEFPGHHALVADMWEKAIRHAGTFSALARNDPTYGIISIEGGAAWGGFPAAASLFESGLLEGISCHVAVTDAAALRSVLLRLREFRMIAEAERLLIGDGHLRVAVDQAKHGLPDIAAAIAAIHETGIGIKVLMHDLYRGAEIATLLQPRETDRQPVYLEVTVGESEDLKSLAIEGMTPAGHRSFVGIAVRGPTDAVASDEPLWTARSAHLKRAALPVDGTEVGKLVIGKKAALLVVERHGGVLTHLLSTPKIDRPPPPILDETPTADTGNIEGLADTPQAADVRAEQTDTLTSA